MSKKIIGLHLSNTQQRVCVGVSGWGKNWNDKVASIEPLSTTDKTFWARGGDAFKVALLGGGEVYIKGEAVIAVEYQEVPDGAA